MKLLSFLVTIGALAATAITFAAPETPAEPAKIGATLNKKQALAISDIPAEVLKAIKPLAANLNILEAEKEWKHGNVYIDVEGKLPNGEEIEFDLLQVKDAWKVVEVQRDLEWAALPKNVRDALLADSPEFEAKRIIESIQHGQDLTVYEFYSVDHNGKESRKEVKVEAGKAEVLKSEWKH